MTEDDRLADLLLTWEESKERGQDVSPEELCRVCPELLDALKERIRLLEHAGWLTPAAPSSPPKRMLAGRYRLDALLGEGGYGQVWKAFDEQLQRAVALKVPKPSRRIEAEQIDQLLGEARRVARLRNPGIVTVHDVVKEGAGYFTVSDLIDGVTLAERLRQGKPTVEESVKLVAQVARVIDYAHREGVVHRDLKPANIFLDAASQPHVGDFGLARSQQEMLDGSDRRATLAYGSPEQLEGKPLDGRADIWSLGVVLYEMLTGRMPFNDENPVRLKEMICTENPPLLDGVPRPVVDVCLRCLAKRPDQRFASGHELAEALERALRGQPRRWGRWLAGVGCLLLAGGLLTWAWLPPRPGNLETKTPQTSPRDVPKEPTTVPPARDDSFRILRGHKGVVRCVAVTADGNLIASGGDDATLRLWLVEESKDASAVLSHDGAVTATAVAPSGDAVLAGTARGSVVLWGLPARGVRHRAAGEVGLVGTTAGGFWSAIAALAPRPDRPWRVCEFTGNDGPIQAVAVSRNSRFVAWVGKNKIEIWEAGGTQPLTVAQAPGEVVHFFAFSGDMLVTAFGYGAERKVTTRSWAVIRVNDRWVAAPRGTGKNLELFDDVKSVTMSGKGDVVLITQSTAVRVFTREAKGPALLLVGSFESPKAGLLRSALSPGNTWALSVGEDRVLPLWATSNQVELAAFKGHTQAITGLAVSEDGGTAATASEDGTVRLWRTPSFDREVAERVLVLGGAVTVEERGGDKQSKVRKPSELPSGNFRLVEVDLRRVDQIADKDVDQVQALTALRSLKLPEIDKTFLLGHEYTGLDNYNALLGLRIKTLDGNAFTGEHLILGPDHAIKHQARVRGTIIDGQIRYAYAKADIVKDGGFAPVRVSGTITRTRLKADLELVDSNLRATVVMKAAQAK